MPGNASLAPCAVGSREGAEGDVLLALLTPGWSVGQQLSEG